jgi:nucleotide-binding universal stress UspA family protein
MLYHLATGVRPYGNPTNISGLRRRLFRAPQPPRAIIADFPPWLQEVILHCLEVDPERRYASAALVAYDLQHPSDVVLTERAQKVAREGLMRQTRQWLRSLGTTPTPGHSVSEQLARAPIVMAAVDVSESGEALRDFLRKTVRRILQTEPEARFVCVNVMKTSRIAMDINVDEEGRNLHVKRLVELKHWARELQLPPDRISHHVLEAPDAASALIEYARANKVDHILMGARASSGLRRVLGSVSSRVVAEAPCTVTVVRVGTESEP